MWADLGYVYPPLVYGCASLAVQPRRNLYVKQSIACESYWKKLDNFTELQNPLIFQLSYNSKTIQNFFKSNNYYHTFPHNSKTLQKLILIIMCYHRYARNQTNNHNLPIGIIICHNHSNFVVDDPSIIRLFRWKK